MTEASDTVTDLDVGLAHHEAGRLAEAEALYRRILTQEPDHPDALNLLGVILQDAGYLIESIGVLSRAVAVDPEFPEAYVNLARAQYAADDPTAARLSSQRAIELDPDLAEAHLQFARSLLALQENAAALAAANRAAVLAPDSADVRLVLDHAHRRLSDVQADQLAPDRDSSDFSTRQILADASADLLAGHAEPAEVAYRLVIEREPDNVEALHKLGQLLRSRGDAAQAVSLLRHAVVAKPDDAELLVELSRDYRLIGDFQASAEAAVKAIALNQADASAQFLLGSARLDLNDPVGAKEALDQAVALAPQASEAHLYLAMACMRLTQLPSAAVALREAVKLKPDDAECLAKLGRVLGELRLYDEALPHLRRAMELAPKDGRVHLALVTVLWQANDIEAAMAARDQALQVAPDTAELWLVGGYCSAALGRFTAAADDYRTALALDPNLDAARFALVKIGLQADVRPDVVRLRTLLEDLHRDERDRVGAGNALGDLLDRAGDYDAAWSAYATAGQLAHASHQAGRRAFDPIAYASQLEAIATNFPPEIFTTMAGLGNPSDLPVFVVGMPRSGTTLVEQIASSHPNVFGAGELEDIRLIAERVGAGVASSRSILRDPVIIAREATAYLQKLRDLGVVAKRAIDDMPDDLWAGFLLPPPGTAAKRVINKMPDNFQWLGLIALLFPRARVILCRRDPRDVGVSCYFQNFGDNLSWTTDLVEIAARAQAFDRLVSHWRKTLPLAILEVRYEDLVQNLEVGSRRLIAFLGLDWNPACLAFHETERTVLTASQWQVRQPLYTSSIGRWRHYRQHLQPLLTGLAGLVPAEDDGARSDDGASGDQHWDALAADLATALAIAVFHHQAGRLDHAEAIYHALLRRNADEPTTLHLLGVLRIDRGEPAQSITLISRSLMSRPNFPPALADLARAYRAMDNAAAAIDAARRALTLDPNLPAALLQLGCALLMQQDGVGAVEVLRHATAVAPTSLEAWVSFATALSSRQDHGSAAEAWQSALALVPDDPRLLFGYAESLADLKCSEEALAIYRKVDALAPQNPRAQYGIARSLMDTGEVAAAANMCRQALATTSDARFWLLLANCEAALGHFDAAADACRSALALDPGSARALHDLAALGDRRDEKAAKDAAEAILGNQSLPIRDRVSAGFALGRICDRQSAYDEAFKAYAVANRLLRDDRVANGYVFDRNNFRERVDWLIATIGPQTFVDLAGLGDASELPVFIVGMPRSGTSLVEQIAASHKLVVGSGERKDIFGILAALEDGQTGCPPTAWDRASVRREAIAYVERIRSQHLHGLQADAVRADAVRIIDKQPENILCLGQIAMLFPRARIIFCRRDARDVSLSCFFQYFRDDPLVWTDDLADCVSRGREIDRLMEHWRKVLPIPILEIQYETLVANLESESRRLIDFLGLEWDPSCLTFYKTERTVMTASHWEVRQPLYATSVDRWRHYQHHLQPMLRELEGVVSANDGELTQELSV